MDHILAGGSRVLDQGLRVGRSGKAFDTSRHLREVTLYTVGILLHTDHDPQIFHRRWLLLDVRRRRVPPVLGRLLIPC